MMLKNWAYYWITVVQKGYGFSEGGRKRDQNSPLRGLRNLSCFSRVDLSLLFLILFQRQTQSYKEFNVSQDQRENNELPLVRF